MCERCGGREGGVGEMQREGEGAFWIHMRLVEQAAKSLHEHPFATLAQRYGAGVLLLMDVVVVVVVAVVEVVMVVCVIDFLKK